MTDWTIYNNLLPWCALTVEQMRAFEASEGEMIWLTSDGGWHPINPPVAPGWIIRVAELAIEDLIEEHEKRALVPQPEADLETCPNCEGTGIAGHPDSGYTCTKCSGCGGVQPEADPVREAALAAGRAQGIEAALAVVTEEARRQLWHARHVGNDTKTRERASSAWSALNIAAQTIRALDPQPEADPVREAAMRDKIARIIIEDQLQLLSDFDVDGELYRHDPECGAAAYVTADAILRALTGGQP